MSTALNLNELLKWDINDFSEHCVVFFKESLQRDSYTDLKNLMRNLSANHLYKAIIFDFTLVKIVDEQCMKEIIAATIDMRKMGVKCYGLQLNENLEKKIIQRGLSQALIPKKDLNAALTDSGLKKTNRIDVEFINPFIQGTLNTLKIQANVELSPGEPYVKGKKADYEVDIAAVLGIISSKFNGSISLCFSKNMFLHVINSMLGEDNTEITSENADAVGELLNIIFGHAKEVLNKKNYSIQQAIPTVIRGADIQLKNMASSNILILPMNTSHGQFYIEIALMETS